MLDADVGISRLWGLDYWRVKPQPWDGGDPLHICQSREGKNALEIEI